MIPKVIHYCWFGGNALPDTYKEYMKTWKRYCPDYEIVEWNEANFDVTQNEYSKEAYDAKKWAFVSDYARLKIIYEHGGIYLDTDVELIKPLDELLADGYGFIGFQSYEQATTGLGFAALPHNECVKKMLDMYDSKHFISPDGSYDLTPCPVRNTVALKKCGLKTGKKASESIQHLQGMNVYPVEYFNPFSADTLKMRITDHTYTIHHYAASWLTNGFKKRQSIKRFLPAWLLTARAIYISRRDVKDMEKLEC